ncbi:MAG TPA: hypothetical protein DCW90_06405 [Lachnospiraceae bacterium]|nr:hypothetical protein [uncultured Lachnoclostridium sp.]HAU85130.1 hypothetical protein [Lachnospiraceae bacterium]
MNTVFEVVNKLRATNSNKEKAVILAANKENELLRDVLEYTYDPFKRYGISEKNMDKLMDSVEVEDLPSSLELFEFLDLLSVSNSNDSLKRQICAYVKFNKYSELVKGIFLKDLKIGVSATTINKVWKGLVPKFEVQLAKKYSDVKLEPEELVFVTEKLDGIRCVAIKSDNEVKFFTRQGKEIFGLNDICRDLVEIMGDKMVYDGELLAINENELNSGDLYRKTTSIVNSKSEDKKGVIFHVFDMLSLEDFQMGCSTNLYADRKMMLNLQIMMMDPEWVSAVPVLYWGTDHSKIPEILAQVESQDKEGIMVNRNMPYECKRTKSLLKVKTMNTCDLEVIGYKEGTGRNKGRLGSLVVSYKNNQVDVGSGFSDDQRGIYWEQRESLIGRVIEVQYFEESSNEKGEFSLRFPIFKEVRELGKEVSYN